jgi:hypothetical protein
MRQRFTGFDIPSSKAGTMMHFIRFLYLKVFSVVSNTIAKNTDITTIINAITAMESKIFIINDELEGNLYMYVLVDLNIV